VSGVGAGAVAGRLSPALRAPLPGAIGWVALPTLAAIALGLTAPMGQAAFLIGLAVAVAALLAYVVGLRSRPALLVAGFLLWLSIERLAVAVLSPRLDPATFPLLLGYKELFFPLAGLVLLPAVPRVWREAPLQLRIVDGLAIAFGVIIVAGFFLSDAPLMDRVVYARRLALLPLIYGVTRLLPWRLDSLRATTRLLVLVAVAVAAFGLLERFFLESLIWREWIPAAYYYHLHTLSGLGAPGSDFPTQGLPVVFYDLTAGVPERRLVSTFLEATTLASFLAIGTILAVATVRPWIVGLATGALIVAAGYLTLGKAGWLITAVGVTYVLVVSVVRRLREPAWLASMAAGLIGALVVISLVLEASGSATGALAHFDGLRQGIGSLTDAPLGRGLGIGGNFGAGILAAESTFGVIMVQLGVLGLLIWAAWMLALAYACATVGGRLSAEPLLSAAVAAALIAFFGTAAFTESAGGFLGNWVYGLVPAALLTVASTTAARPEGLRDA
jgi:hypothetical protein